MKKVIEEIKKEVAMEEKKEVISIIEIPTQTSTAFKLEDGRVLDANFLLVEIYKDIQYIKNSLT